MTKDVKNEREFEILAIQGIMNNKDGRHFMWRLLKNAGMFDDSFNADPYVNARNVGSRANGVFLNNELKEAAPVNYMKMIEEHINE